MTKRWERELRRLDDVDAPTERIRAHAADRPTDPSHGDGLPPRRQRITAGVVAVVVFVAAGTFAWQAFRPSSEKGDVVQPGPGTTVEIALVANHEDGPSSPSATLDVAGVSVPGVLTSYSWSDGNGTLNADTVAPSFGPGDYTLVALPAALEVTGDATAAEVAVQAAGEFPFTTIEDLGAVSGAVPINQAPGRYVLQVMAHWPQGDVPFYFPIELTPQMLAPPATLAFMATDEPEAFLQYGDLADGSQAGVRGEYQWCDGTDVACVAGIPEFPSYPPVSKFLEIPAGTSVMLESAVSSIKGGFLTMGGKKASPTFEDPRNFGSTPTEPGKYALEVHVALDGDNGAHGSATFWFGVEVVDSASPAEDPAISLADTSWHVAEIDGSPIPDQMADASLVFGDTTVSGWTGCNRFETSFEVAEMHLATRGGSVTQVACDPSEADLLEVIFDDPSIQMEDSRLLLTGPDGKTIELLSADAAPVDELRVWCQPGATQILDTRVNATPVGVVVSVTGAGHADAVMFDAVGYQVSDHIRVPLPLGPGQDRINLPLAPGSWVARCDAPEAGSTSMQEIKVLDPGHLWAEPEVECEGRHAVGAGFNPPRESLEEAVHSALTLEATDEIRSPMYPGTPVTLNLPAQLVVVRHGTTVAALDVTTGSVEGEVCDFADLEQSS